MTYLADVRPSFRPPTTFARSATAEYVFRRNALVLFVRFFRHHATLTAPPGAPLASAHAILC